MRRILYPALMVAAVVIAVISLTGCNWVFSLFQSGEAAILAFSFDVMEGTATIDPEARTVEIEIPPFDLGTLTPAVEVSVETHSSCSGREHT